MSQPGEIWHCGVGQLFRPVCRHGKVVEVPAGHRQSRREQEAAGRLLPDGQYQPSLPNDGQVRSGRQEPARERVRKVIMNIYGAS